MVSLAVGQDQRVPDHAAEPGHRSAELLGELARELSSLVRRDVEVSAAERLPTLRRALLDLAAIAVVALAALFTLGALSVAAGRLLEGPLSGWAAAVVVAGAWAVVAVVGTAVLVRPRTQPREREELFGLLQMLTRDQGLEELRAASEEARDEAEREMRRSAEALVETLLHEAAEHQLKALPAAAKRELESVETDAPELLGELLALLAMPARAGLHALGRWVEPASEGPKRSSRN
jgi:hypothetical protein